VLKSGVAASVHTVRHVTTAWCDVNSPVAAENMLTIQLFSVRGMRLSGTGSSDIRIDMQMPIIDVGATRLGTTWR
jgi:hypothetical protein